MLYEPVSTEDENEIADSLERKYDLEERLIKFAVLVINLSEQLPSNHTGNHIANQLLRSGTSPASNYAEAGGCESRKDFIHKMGICLKELKETSVWLRILQSKQVLTSQLLTPILSENDQLTRIFKSSILTARKEIK